MQYYGIAKLIVWFNKIADNLFCCKIPQHVFHQSSVSGDVSFSSLLPEKDHAGILVKPIP